jgi:Flp pilus assembly pilin Flp
MPALIRQSQDAGAAPRWLADERGIETLEWILMGGLIVAVGLVVYPGTLQPQLTAALNAIGGIIVAAAGS